jgi:ADP-ribosyl-[dinitrogen reductase] hydrolase
MRTSQSHPLQIAAVWPAPNMGRIGITFCPGKKQLNAAGVWDRQLAVDLDAIATWGAVAIITLVESAELRNLQVGDLGAETATRHMEWLHLPIQDYSVPTSEFEAAWAQVGESVRHRIRSGFHIVIHCKGGLGRAGMIAAKLMIELGAAAEEAISQVRKARPGAIETAEQLAYVRAQNSVPEKQPPTTSQAIRDRAMGSLLGLALGDAVGTTLEFKTRDTAPLLTDMIGGGPFRLTAGQWTDDTATALALADSLSASADLDAADLMQRFSEWRSNGAYSCTGSCFDIGLTTSEAISRWQATGDPVAGSKDPNTAGNGSLMRLAPVVIRHHRNRLKLRDIAARQSRVTHAARDAVDACVAYADLMADAIEGAPRTDVLRAREGYSGEVGRILQGGWRGAHRNRIPSSGYVIHSLEAALWSIGSSGDYRGSVLRAANLAHDADTTAAIAGQLSGALCGASHLPEPWLAKLAWAPRIRIMAEAIFPAE